jgi:exopolysaccharide biosynthesis polyprenyl glycosylphosphotransferase
MTLAGALGRTAPAIGSRGSVTRDIRAIRRLSSVLDLAMLIIAVTIGWQLRTELEGPLVPVPIDFGESVIQSAPPIIATWLVVLGWRGAYDARTFGEGASEFRAIGLASNITAGLVGMGCYLLSVPLSRGFVLLTFIIGTFLLILERFTLRHAVFRLRRTGRLMHRVIAVGGPSGVSEVVDALRQSRHVGYEVVGAAVPDGVAVEADRFPVPVLGSAEKVRRLCDDVGADTVLVTRGGFATAREMRRVAWDLEGSSIQLVVVPSVNEVAGSRIHVRPVAGLPLLHLEQPQGGEAGGLTKRVFDMAGATIALILLSPVMLALAVAVAAEDRGPVFFRQPRIGRDGRDFYCLKFRSMYVDAALKERALRNECGQSGALWKLEVDPRVTRIGRFIRRYSLDELPQLLNVIRGEMSLVGPRPQQPWEVETYTYWEQRRLRVRPGMTGLWQVSGRSQLSFDEAIRLDLYYVDNWSMTADLVIMAKTVGAVLRTTGAY